MNTTGPVTTVTDELLAEIELCESCDCGLDMDRADVRTVMAELRRLREENVELAQSLAESRANDQAAMGWLTSLRRASGDRGERMLPELVAYIEGLAKDAGRLAELAEQANVNCRNTAYYLRKYRPDMATICSGWCDEIDTAMATQ